MSIHPVQGNPAVSQLQSHSVSTPVSSQPSASPLPEDRVTLSSAALAKSKGGGDADHDHDSR